MSLRLSLAILIASLFFSACVGAQEKRCTETFGRLQLVSQTEVDEFQQRFGPCNTVGVLEITETQSTPDPIYNLDGLIDLIKIDTLRIASAASLTNLDGLFNVSTITSDFYLDNNSSLTNVDGLAGLVSVGGDFRIDGNPSLFNVDGLVGLNSVGDLSLDGSFANLDALANLSSVSSSLYIRSVSDCQGLAPVLGYPNASAGLSFTVSLGQCGSIQDVFQSVVAPISNSSFRVEGGAVLVDFDEADVSNSPFSVAEYEAACFIDSNYSVLQVEQELADNSPVTIPLSAYEEQPVDRLTLLLNIDHDRPDHLQIVLRSPSGQTFSIWDRAADESWQGCPSCGITKMLEVAVTSGAELGDQGWAVIVEDVEIGPITREGYLYQVEWEWTYQAYRGVADSALQSPIEVDGMRRGPIYDCWFAPRSQLGANPKSWFTADLRYTRPTGVTASIEGADESAHIKIGVADNGGDPASNYRGFCASSQACALCVIETDSFDVGAWPACRELPSAIENPPPWVDPCADQVISHAVSPSPSLTLSGLKNGQGYWCSVQAENSRGFSNWEPDINGLAQPNLIPEYSPTGLPIWLLYQATQ